MRTGAWCESKKRPPNIIYANGYLVRVFVPATADVPKFMERFVDWGTYRLTRMMDLQVTGGSSSACAARAFSACESRVARRRAMLIEAAAKRWNVPAAECEREAVAV